MSAPAWPRALVAAVATAVVVTTLSGCISPTEAFAPCPDDVVQVEIFNTYADHSAADRHVIVGDDARTFCATAFSYDQLPRRSYAPAELEQRRITVMRFTAAGNAARTLWAYSLPGDDTGMAIVLDDGTSYHLANRNLLGYYAAKVNVIPRSELPRRS